MSSADLRRLYNIAAVVLLAHVAWAQVESLRAVWRIPQFFDDAYMFARYATNLRHGLGISWNLDGAHTYGPTSLSWLAVVLASSYLPIGVWKMLTLASWLCSIGAVIALAWAVATNAGGNFLSSAWRVFPLVALPLAGAVAFTRNAVTGMETMLAALLGAVFVGLALQWSRGTVRAEIVGLVGFLFFLTRPDAAIAVLMFPLLLFSLMPGVGKASVTKLLGIFLAGVALDLAVCKVYFHSALPLAFYMKSFHAYEGFVADCHAELMILSFLAACELYLVSLIVFSRREDWRLLVCCVAPALATFAYLGTVNQIMGYDARFYVPYFAFFIVPSLLVLDRRLTTQRTPGETLWPNRMLLRSLLSAVVVVCCVALFSDAGLAKIGRAEGRTHFEYDPAQLDITATLPLAASDKTNVETDFADIVVAPLPRGATVAASEVGYLGFRAPQVNVIDLTGLNDSRIAQHGFDINELIARKPDIIWMPHEAYTYQRGKMLSNPSLLEQYDLYAGAAEFGLAIRKASPSRQQIDRQMQIFWSADYPGSKMSDYLVRAATWTGQKRRVINDY